MLRMYDFECVDCHKVFEDLVDPSIKKLPCVDCTGNSKRLIAAPRIDWLHMGLDPGFPTAYERWGDAKTKHHKHDKGTMNKGKANNLLMY